MAITLGCVGLCLCIAGLCVYQHKRKMASTSGSILPARNQGVRVGVNPITNVDRNVVRTNAFQVPYPISMPAAYGTPVEEPPPPYDVFMSTYTAQGESQQF